MLQVLDEKYYAGFLNLVQPRQRDVTHVLAALVMVSCATLGSVASGHQNGGLYSIAACHCSVATSACLLLILGCSETCVDSSWPTAAPGQRHHVATPPLQACHDMVPPDWLQPVLRHLCNQFIHDRARPEEITTGLRTVRELCVRMPLVMTPEMLQVSPWCGDFGTLMLAEAP